MKASWILVNPSSGSGNGSVAVSSAAEHSGRVARQSTLTITAANVEDTIITVNQAGKPEYVDAQDNATASKGGQVVTITGKSNSKKLTFSLGAGNLDLTLPEKYTANSVDTMNGVAIAGDPGASAEYDFSIQFTVALNDTIEEKSRQIVVTADGGQTDTITLTQTAGDAYLHVKLNGEVITSIDLAYTGEAVSFNVESNTDWSVN